MVSALERSADGYFEVHGVPLKRVYLRRLMKQAQRCGVLFKGVRLAEYAFLKLVVALKDGVRSRLLARAIAPLVEKLLKALSSVKGFMVKVFGEIPYLTKRVGWSLAESMAGIAVSWGYLAAYRWAYDEGFARYLTIMNLPELRKQISLEE